MYFDLACNVKRHGIVRLHRQQETDRPEETLSLRDQHGIDLGLDLLLSTENRIEMIRGRI